MSFRAREREREEAEAQARNTAKQRELLRKRAAKRAKERREAGLGATTSEGATGGNGPRPSSRARAGARRARPGDAQWGLHPSEWTGDVGSNLVNLQTENLALRRERARWEAEKRALEEKIRAAPYGRVTTPSPPPPSIPDTDAGDSAGGGSTRPSRSRPASRAAPPPPLFDDDDAVVPAGSIDEVFGAASATEEIDDVAVGAENVPPSGFEPATSTVAAHSTDSVANALESLSGAEAMTTLMMAEMRASRNAVADLRREMRLERERARQAEARQRRQLEQTRRAADAAVMTAESVAESQKNHMAKAMRAAETRTEAMEMLVPRGVKKKQQTEAAYTAADVAENALTTIAEMVPGSTGDLEEQQEMLRRRRFDRHAARLGQISAAASAVAIATVHANAARLRAVKEKNSKGVQTEDELDKFLYCKVMTDYFLPAVLMSPEEKIAAEAKRKREALAAVEARRRWALAQEKEGTHSRESRRWLLHREAKDQEAESTDAVAAAFADAERATLKAIRKNHKSSLQTAPPGWLGADARGSILAAIGDAERRATDALERVHTCVMAEICAAQENGFMSEEERHRLDARARRFCALLDSLLRDFQKEVAAVCDAPDVPRDDACAPAGNCAPTGVFADVMHILAPAAARLTLRARRTRRDAASRSADQSVPLTYLLRRAEDILSRAVPRAIEPILPALRAARNMGALDPTGVGAMMVGIDAADASVSAALEAMAPAAAYAAWQLKNTRVGPARGPGTSKRMRPLRPDDPTEALAEDHDVAQTVDDALEKCGSALRESRRVLTAAAKKTHERIEETMAATDPYDDDATPPLPARVANGILAVTSRLREVAEHWGVLLDDAAEEEAYASGGRPASLSSACRAAADWAPRALADAGARAKALMASCTEIYFPALAPPPPPPPPPANNAIPYLHLEEKMWRKGDEPEVIPEDPPEIGFLELEAEVDAAVAGIRDAGEAVAARVEKIVKTIAESVVYFDEAADPHDVDACAPASSVEIAAVSRAARNLERAIREALDELAEDAKDAAAIVLDSAMPPPFEYDDEYDPIKNRKGKCEDPEEENPKDHRVNKNDCKSAGVRVRTAEQTARARVETSLDSARAALEALLAEAPRRGGILWRVKTPPPCPGAVTLGVPAPAALLPFTGSAAGLSQHECAAEIAEGLHESEIAEARRVMDAEAEAAAAAAHEAAMRDAEAIMPPATPEPPRVPPGTDKQLPPKTTMLPQRDFYARMRAHFDEDVPGTVTLKKAFEEFDEDGDGALNAEELRKLVAAAVPDATAREMRHFEVLALPGGDGVDVDESTVSLGELRAALRGSQRAHKAARYRASATGSAAHAAGVPPEKRPTEPPPKIIGGLHAVLSRVDAALEAEQIPPKALFDAFDSDKDGKLDAAELKDMFWRLLPDFDADEVRFAMAHVFEHAAANPEDDVPATPAEGSVEVASGVASMGEKRGTVTFKTFDDAIAALRGASKEEP